MWFLTIINLFFFGVFTQAGYPPTPTGLTVIESEFLPGVNISYKKVKDDICGENAASYSGYVKFPPNTMPGVDQNYPVNLFFWYFESQNEPLENPLSIWFNGGPGASSIFGLFVENGPCHILNDSKTSVPNSNSWNKYANMLYLDQPVQTGFSYDIITEGILNLQTLEIVPGGTPSNTNISGAFASQNDLNTANTTENAARQFWYFLQTWTQGFDKYTDNRKNFDISIWTESYGGRYGPAFARYIKEKNTEIQEEESIGKVLALETLGVINGCIDLPLQEFSYPPFAYNNSYGIPGINETVYIRAEKNLDPCLKKIKNCQSLAEKLDPDVNGNIELVNEECKNASDFCQNDVEYPFVFENKWAYYDITHCYLDPFPAEYYDGFLASADVQQALGVPVNYTESSPSIGLAFNKTGDYARNDKEGYVKDIGTLLDSNVQVALVYGDRDYACNWVGGEAVSHAINYSHTGDFNRAGYAEIEFGGPDTFWGVVRQHGNFSFSRIYQSGHMVPAYQPELALELFRRVQSNHDFATGTVDLITDPGYSTSGDANSTHTETPTATPSPTCYYWFMPSTCAQVQIDAVREGKAGFQNDYIITSPTAPPTTCPTLPAKVGGGLKGDFPVGDQKVIDSERTEL
ncbi:hypothetical protein Egran_05622 [Elaphomyces granulatus]|uniref:Carboxypeptidase n=1 Tax=Elaphomyces granulatus TaxID=519963 RepID=A0A232LR48_9EURO|nr:hypothetical protein Egran_05622 [Elaphomyces granulatus]